MTRSDSMAILFKTAISENSAFEMIETALSGAYQYDGYLNVVSDAGEKALSWGPAEEFKAADMVRTLWIVVDTRTVVSLKPSR
jgi:hypothetical protein